MAYEFVFEETDIATGKQGRFLPNPVLFSEIFDGAPQFYTGSTVTVQEVLEIETDTIIGQERFVDVDFKWFDNKIYLGTYQFGDLLRGQQPESELGEGFITNRKMTFIRRSQYSVTANPSTPLAYEQTFVVDNCNFETIEVGIEFGGASLTVNRPRQNESLMQGKISQTRAPLVDTNYNQFFNQIGLYLNPGCTLNRIAHRIAIINSLQTDFLPYPEYTCSLLGG